MIQAEFDRWWADLTMRFPNVDSWLVRVAPDAIAQRTTLRTWHDVLADVQIADCLEINRQMQAGDAPFVNDYHEQDIPSHVRRMARQLAFERRDNPRPEDDQRRPSHFPAGKIYKRVLELVSKGATGEEAKTIALNEFPIGKPSWEPRYNCRVCWDAGMVTVASPTAIQAVLSDQFERCHHRLAAMLCSCRGHLPQNPKRPRCVFDTTKDFQVFDFLWGRTEVDRFREWVEAKRQEYWNSKRDPAFDKFNERAFA